jgi:transcriptional regulator with XRE-family HTH domain
MSVASILSQVKIPSAELARTLQVSDGHIADLKSGRRQPSLRLARRLADATNRPDIIDAAVSKKLSAA